MLWLAWAHHLACGWAFQEGLVTIDEGFFVCSFFGFLLFSHATSPPAILRPSLPRPLREGDLGRGWGERGTEKRHSGLGEGLLCDKSPWSRIDLVLNGLTMPSDGHRLAVTSSTSMWQDASCYIWSTTLLSIKSMAKLCQQAHYQTRQDVSVSSCGFATAAYNQSTPPSPGAQFDVHIRTCAHV